MELQKRKTHWETVYGSKTEQEVSWFQAQPVASLDLISREAPPPETRIIDVGGGASRLVDALLGQGFTQLTVLDVAAAALDMSRDRLGVRASLVDWICVDITQWTPTRTYDLWHDRAVFHFLTEAAARAAYKNALRQALRPGGIAIIASFDLDGPERCSALPVQRYSAQSLGEELGDGFALVEQRREAHQTPFNTIQKFQFSRFRRL